MSKIIEKKLSLSKFHYLKKHIEIINVIFSIKLTNKETEVLTHFIDYSLSNPQNKNFLNAEARKYVMKKLSLSAGGLSNYEKSFKTKKLLITKAGFITIDSICFPNPDKQGYRILISE